MKIPPPPTEESNEQKFPSRFFRFRDHRSMVHVRRIPEWLFWVSCRQLGSYHKVPPYRGNQIEDAKSQDLAQ